MHVAKELSYSDPHLTYIKYPQTLEVLCKIHDEYVKRCDRCQRYMPVPNLPTEVYHSQNNSWPFMQWAIDLVGPMPPAPAKKDIMIITTNYFTTWFETEALSSTKEADVERFV
ncbi:unnamed protein product [Prunus brigantina]